MELANSQILLDSPNGAYYAGTVVKGRLQFKLDTTKKIRAIAITFFGSARTSWMDSKTVYAGNGKSQNVYAEYSATEEYLSETFSLTGGPKSEIYLPPGEHVYPFSIRLPPMLPSSFESKHGYIRYMVKATLDRPWRFNQHVKEMFTVVTPVDLNSNVKAKEPVQLEVEKYFCCWCCVSRPLTMVIRIPFSGYVPGQNIPVTLEVDNVSDVRVERIVIGLVRTLKWIAHYPKYRERVDRLKIAEAKKIDGVGPRRSKLYTHQLPVPPTQACDFDQCSIIDCSYSLQMTAEVSGCHCDSNGEVSIIIGTVPILQTSSRFQTPVSYIVNPGPTSDNMYPILPPETSQPFKLSRTRQVVL